MVTNATYAENVFRSRYETYILSSKVTIVFCDIIMALTIIVGLVGNVSICLCILKTRHLRTYININMVNSCIVNIICCTCLLPIRIELYTGYTMFSSVKTICGIGTFFRTFCDTMQFFMLTMASFERYQAVINPFQKVGLKKRSVVLVIISWLLALTLGVISALFFIDGTLYAPCSFLDNTPHWADYDQYLIFPLGTALLCIIIVLYSLILKTLFEHSLKMARHKRKRTIVPATVKVNDADASGSYTGQNNDMKGSTVSSQLFALSFRNVKDTKESPKMNNTSSITLNVPVNVSPNQNKNVQTTVHEQTTTYENKATSSSIHDNTIEVVGMDGSVQMTKTTDDNVSGAVCLMSKKNRENGRRRVELKASRKIAILVGTFTCCWVPLPVFVISNSISGPTMLSYSMFCVLIVLGTLASSVTAINPVLYALLNRPLNSALKTIFNLDRNLCGRKSS